MGKRGQVTIELMLLLTLILIYLNTVVQPSLAVAEAGVKDASGLAKVRIAADRLANAIDELSVSGGSAKMSLTLFIPNEAEIFCPASTADGKPAIKMAFALQREATPCGTLNPPSDPDNDADPKTCTKILPVEAKTVSCSPQSLKGTVSLAITRSDAGDVSVLLQ